MYSSSRFKRGFYLNLQPAIAWNAIFGFSAFSALCILAGLGKILNLVFPLGALAVGVILYFRYPILYVGFTWWMWFLSPLVRRLSDYRTGFTDPSPILLTPFLVTLIALITFLRFLPDSRRQGGLPFVLSTLGVFYGYLVGLIKASPVTVSVALLSWLAPIVFGCHLFVNWRDYPNYRQNIQRVFLWCALVAGVYGVFQYLVAPEWDRFWLKNVIETGSTSFGTPEPLAIRVWSTMHGPGVFAFVMMAALLLLLSNVGPLCLPATAAGYLSFLLSAVRSAWLGWLVGVLSLVTALKPKLKMRLILILLVVAVCVIPLTTIEPFSEVIGTRFQTLADVKNDGSAGERQENYDKWLNYALTNFLGDGVGVTPGLLDSGIMEILISLGWFGAIFYGSGLLSLLFQLVHASKIRADPFASTARAIAVAMLCQIIGGSVMSGLPGMILWVFLSLGVAADKYYCHQNSIQLKEADSYSVKDIIL
jgi:hypothetical protein